MVSLAIAGPVCECRPTSAYYRHLSDHLVDHLKPAVPSVDVDYWPKFDTVQEACAWKAEVSLNTTYAEPAAAGIESDDMTWDECYNKMLSFEDSLFEMNDSLKDPGEDGKHAAPGELRTDLPSIWRHDSVQSIY